MPKKTTSSKKRSRTVKKVTVRDLAPRKRKGDVKGGMEQVSINFSKMETSYKERG